MNVISRNNQKLLSVSFFCLFLCVCISLLPQTSRIDSIYFQDNPYNNTLNPFLTNTCSSNSNLDDINEIYETQSPQLSCFLIFSYCEESILNNYSSDSNHDSTISHQINQLVCQLSNIPPPLSI